MTEEIIAPKFPSQRFIDGMHPWQSKFFELFDDCHLSNGCFCSEFSKGPLVGQV